MPLLVHGGQDGPYFGLMAQGLMNRHREKNKNQNIGILGEVC